MKEHEKIRRKLNKVIRLNLNSTSVNEENRVWVLNESGAGR